MPMCYVCNHSFTDYGELARHIAGSKKGHAKSKKWAAKFLLMHNLSPRTKRDKPKQVTLSEKEKDYKASTITELSGEVETVKTWCPTCKTINRQALPIEFTQSKEAWKSKTGILITNCPRCKK